MLVETFPVGPLGCNCSIIADPDSGLAIVVDPGGEFEKIRGELEARDLRAHAIVHTHTHIDHVGATAPLQTWSGAEAHIHEADRFLYDMLPIQAAMLGIPEPEKCDMRGTLTDDFSIRAGKIELGVLHTPGHTPGSVSFLVDVDGEPCLFSGDTLFRGGIGRTDLWGGDHGQIVRSLETRLLSLDDGTRVVPGHGPESSIAVERRTNPFLQGLG